MCICVRKGQWVDPVNVTYRDNWLVSELPPNPQGIATLQMLNMLELYNVTEMKYHSTDYIHLSVEIKKLVFADRAKYYADGYYKDVCVPVNQLIDKTYAQKRSQLINFNKAAKIVDAGNVTCQEQPYSGDTIYLTVAGFLSFFLNFI